MATSPGDLPAREQLELFSTSGQGATQSEQDMAKKSDKKADKQADTKAKSKAEKKSAKKARGGGGGGGGGGSAGGGGGGMGTPGTQDASLEAEARRRYLNYALS